MIYRLETSSPKVIPTTPTDKSNDRLEKPDAKTPQEQPQIRPIPNQQDQYCSI
jgi:hypothetical protein